MSKSKNTERELIEKAYWVLIMNTLEPLNKEEFYSQDEIEELIDQLREFLV